MDHVHRVLLFDRFALDLARGCLRTGDQEIDLRPKTFDVLYYLLENAGRLVSKRELFEAVWPKVSVCDDTLVQCVRELRQKFGDDGRRLIKTVSRRGYLLDVTVLAAPPQSLSDGSTVTPDAEPQKQATKLILLHHALRTITAYKLRIWAAAAAGLTCLALAILYLLAPITVANPGHVSFAGDVAAESHQHRTFKDCADCPEMVALPAGKFMMGSLYRGVGSFLPKSVVIPKPFAIGKFEVTINQFSTFVAETGSSAGTLCQALVGDNGRNFIFGPPEVSFRSPGFAVTGTHPAVCINWRDAREYVAWLKSRTGKLYRLPTDAEWEHAARADTETYYSFGDAEPCAYGRFANNRTPFPHRDGCGDDMASPIPVGQLKPNPWGIFDMHGNAWEWVDDCAPGDTFDGFQPTDVVTCLDSRVARGGSWANNAWELGSPVRRIMGLNWRRNHIGFRVALSLGE
jgi:formylglycine-generating enzyme